MSQWVGLPENYLDYIGFVYIIENTHTDAKKQFYIGKKQLLKKTRLLANKSRKRSKIVWRDNGAESYYGSSKELLEDINRLGKEFFKRTVIECCTSKFHMSYAELMWQLEFNALLDPRCYNGIISCRLGKVPNNYKDIKRDKKDLNLHISF